MKICKNCTNPCEDGVRFCVTCGSNEFLSEEPDKTELSEGQFTEDPIFEESDIIEDTQPETPINEMAGFTEKFSSPEYYDESTEARWEKKTIAVKWPLWVKAAVFLMSFSILVIVAILFFTVIPREDSITLPAEPEPEITLVAVPTNLVGATDSSAQAILESLGFVVVVERVYHDEVAEGNVIVQNPHSGLLQSGERVSLYVSLGRQSALMPDLMGMTRENADSVLSGINFGFVFWFEAEYDETIAQGRIIRQSQPSGTELFPGSRIILTESLGPPPDDTPATLPRFVINYNANGGLGTMPPIPAEQGQVHIVLASQFTRSGFAFDGWNTQANGSGTSFAPGSSINVTWGDINLFAQWIDSHVTVSYHPNGGMGQMADVLVVRYQNHAVANSEFVRAGYSFVGWNTSPDGRGRSYIPHQTMASLGDNVILFAQWQAAHIAVTHINNVPSSGRVDVSLNLTGQVMPQSATVRSPIIWSVISGEGVSFFGNVLTVSQSGNVTVRATIPNGRAAGSDFIQDFTIAIVGETSSNE